MTSEQEHKRLPVTVLSGFLGAGKTTLLNYILNDPNHKLRIAVIVNDMNEVNVDAKLVQLGDKKEQSEQLTKKMVEMSNGCICCTLQADLMVHVAELAKENAFDYLVIESTGISEPIPVAQTFSFDLDYFLKAKEEAEEEDDCDDCDHEHDHEHEEKHEEKHETNTNTDDSGSTASTEKQQQETETEEETKESVEVPNLRDLARLDTMVTVVDCRNFLDDYTSEDTLKTREMSSGEEDERSVVNLLADQVEFADVIILNKIDLVSKEELQRLKNIIGSMNPEAQLLEASFGRVPLNRILNTGLFDFDKAMTRNDWIEELEKKEHNPETLEYGIVSFVYRRKRPFHPLRLSENFIGNADLLGQVLRSKGFFWLCTKMDNYGIWSQAGGTLRVQSGEHYWASVPDDHIFEEQDKKEIESLKEKGIWDENFGDRRQELVFIGIQLNKEEIIKVLDECLLTDEEMKMGQDAWKEFEDPIDLDFNDGDEEYDEEEEYEEGEEGEDEENDEDNENTEDDDQQVDGSSDQVSENKKRKRQAEEDAEDEEAKRPKIE